MCALRPCKFVVSLLGQVGAVQRFHVRTGLLRSRNASRSRRSGVPQGFPHARQPWERNDPVFGNACRSIDMVSASRHPRHSKLCSTGCPANAGMLRTQRIVCSQRGHLGRCSDMAEQKPQKPPTGYSGIAPTDFPSRRTSPLEPCTRSVTSPTIKKKKATN